MAGSLAHERGDSPSRYLTGCIVHRVDEPRLEVGNLIPDSIILEKMRQSERVADPVPDGQE